MPTPAPKPLDLAHALDARTYAHISTGLDGQLPGLTRGMVGGPVTFGSPPADFSTAAGIPNLQVWHAPELANTNVAGFVIGAKANANSTPAIFMKPDGGVQTTAHEAEHLLARQGLGTASKVNSKFSELIGPGGLGERKTFVDNAVAARPRLEQLGMRPNGYFTPDMVQFQGGYAPNLFNEQAATMSALEAVKGIDLTKDPVLTAPGGLFADKNVREAYNAVTGLRQTRLDARDLAPYTRVAEPVPTPAPKASLLDSMGDTVRRLTQGLGMSAAKP